MKKLLQIIAVLLMLAVIPSVSYGQFWKKRGAVAGGDAFAAKSKKGPNIYSSKPPRTKSRSKLYGHSISKKKLKKKNKSMFSSSRKRYKGLNSRPKSSGTKDINGSSSGGRKSGKGRKKEK